MGASLWFFFATLLSTFQTLLSGSAPLLTPMTKDPTTLQYTTTIYQRTPLKAVKFSVDLGFSFLWVDCQRRYKSTSYLSIPCNSTLCASLNSLACSNCFTPPKPGCANDTCALFPENSFTRAVTIADALRDTVALPTTDGRNPGSLARLPNFAFSCSRTKLLRGLASGATGVLALGRSNFSLPAQISTSLSLPNLFALCLSGSSSMPGVAFFGTGGPYIFLPGIDLSKSLTYSPLILNPVGNTIITYYGHPSDEYFIGVTSIKINGKRIPINSTLLNIDANGFGGTKISTVANYTALETSIYRAFTKAFMDEAVSMNITLLKPVKPFNVCFNPASILSTRVGPAVPAIDLVLQAEDVFWRIFGANSVARVKDDLLCLAFVDGGLSQRASIVVGGYQLEDNLVQFDLEKKRVGFSSSLLLKQTTCSNFNFTSKE